MEFLKKVLSEATYEKIVKAMGNELCAQMTERMKSFDIDIAEEKMIPKAVFDSERNKIKDLTDQITLRDNQLIELNKQSKGNSDLQAEISRLQEENKKVSIEFEEKLNKQAYEFNLDGALKGAKARNTKAVRALLEEDKLKLNNGMIEGLEEQLKALKEGNDYLFEGENIANGAGGVPNGVDKFNITEGFALNIPDVLPKAK